MSPVDDTYLTCNCNQCGQRVECIGRSCATNFTVDISDDVIFNHFCVNDTEMCNKISCCNAKKCNGIIPDDDDTTTTSSPITGSPIVSMLRADTTGAEE